MCMCIIYLQYLNEVNFMSFFDEVRNELNKEEKNLTDSQEKDIGEIANAVKVAIMEKAKNKDLTIKNEKRHISGSIHLRRSSDDYYYIYKLPGNMNYIDEHDYNGIVSVHPYEKNKDIYIEIDSKFIFVLNEAKRLLEKENISFDWELSCNCERQTGIIILKTIKENFTTRNTNSLVVPKEYECEFFKNKTYKYANRLSSLYRICLSFHYKYSTI